MAKRNAKVLLGFPDEVITEKNQCFVDFTTNKIGGKPDWYGDNHRLPTCQLCGLSLPLILQIYAPLEKSPYHRTLYIFACINPNCWNHNESWVCLRIQQLDTTTEVVRTETTLNTDEWCDGADNWEDEENGNTIERLNNRLESSDEDISSGMAQLSYDERNANSGAGCLAGGATGKLLSPTATAEIEEDESEVITIDTPTACQFDLVALLESAVPVPQVPSSTLQFVSFFLSVEEEERLVTNSPTNAEHVKELLQEYQALAVDEESNTVSLSVCNQTDEGMSRNNENGEKYEKSVPAHGDKMFHHFISKIQNNPGQVNRYIRDAGAPLFLYPARDVPLSCRHCQGYLVPEIQILPTLIPCLKLQGGGSGHLEFGTVVVYTCKRSCWTPSETKREEFVIVQCEKIKGIF